MDQLLSICFMPREDKERVQYNHNRGLGIAEAVKDRNNFCNICTYSDGVSYLDFE